ncbi:hypothetical protein H310_07065 [Aphanomyces invadans]|uniref:Uncharacterized protein n=1 Tax=Aphanomyces invadans TaxID=157072 RepID=A0A024U4C7_9STRA|nr:hypothetical protein H310_07065 [Aphanomyces invadans]ETW00438.1 hypothetical protein H310_07065 [Aphanomyces invadans]|eukprot:XP_008870573.1 hypothetical protein H310_07065 [Aphanomyces invadans]
MTGPVLPVAVASTADTVHQPSISQGSPILSATPAPPALVTTGKFSRFQYILSFAGILYMAGALVSSCWYAIFLGPSMTTDFWWRGFNSSVHAFLLHAMDTLHKVDSVVPPTIDLTSNLFVMDEMAPITPPSSPTYVRSLVFGTALAPDEAIVVCRRTDEWTLFWVITQYCWLDFNQTWSVAHTAKRERRCIASYAQNAAMYVESILRNTDMDQVMVAFGADGGEFDVGLHRFLRQSLKGRQFVESVSRRPFLSPVDEAAYWSSFNVTMWRPQYQNLRQHGIQEYTWLAPTLGGVYDLDVMVLPYLPRQVLWTTGNMCCGFYCDLWYAQSINASLVRGDTQFWGAVADIELLLLGRDRFNPTQDAIRRGIGPLNSIDLYLVPVPTALKALYLDFRVLMNTARLENVDNFASDFDFVQPIHLFPTVSAWSRLGNVQFVGGSPLCNVDSTPTAFLQREWGYDDGCDSTRRLAVTLKGPHLLFALVMATAQMRAGGSAVVVRDWIDRLCRYVQDAAEDHSCAASLIHAFHAFQKFTIHMLPRASRVFHMYQDVLAEMEPPLELVQMVAPANTAPFMLRHALLDPTDPTFSIVGWGYILDWVEGNREVVSFAGDADTMHLVSYQYDAVDSTALNSNALPRSIASLFSFGVWYVSWVFGAAAFCMVGVAAFYSFQISGSNMLYFHRVAGPIWIGRPLLFLRGLTAVILLSSSSLDMVQEHGLRTLVNRPRTWIETAVVAAESTWVTYVLLDVSLVATKSCAAICAPLSSFIMFVLAMVVDILFPLRATIFTGRKCVALSFDSSLLCTTNTIHSGSTLRALLLLGANAAVCLAVYVVVCFTRHVLGKPVAPHRETFLLYPESSMVFFQQLEARSPTSEWWIDAASNVMCGMILITFRDVNYVLDVKSWNLMSLPPKKFKKRGSVSTFVAPILSKAQSEDVAAPLAVRRPDLTASPTVGDLVVPRHPSWRSSVSLVVGFAYIVCTLSSSVTYLTVLEGKMSNDFWWQGFNSTGGHRFLASLFTWQYQPGSIDLTRFALYDVFNTTHDAVEFALPPTMNIPSTDLDQRHVAIEGLRSMDGCLAPWLATQYCWVDFHRTWDLANSPRRQTRCLARATNNAAVYLESVLRNIDLTAFDACWGDAFEVAVGNELRKTRRGQSWLLQTWSAPRHTSAVWSEVALWDAMLLTQFDVLWQNYYITGVHNTLAVQNSFGFQYTLTMKRSDPLWRLAKQTTFKMYWTWASDLWAMASNTSSLLANHGRSLVRTSADFAFRNVTMQQILQENGTLPSPLGWTSALVEQRLGPYGSVDVRHLPVPAEIASAVHTFELYLNTLLFSSENATMRYKDLADGVYMNSVPLEWRRYTFLGGSPLCFTMSTDPGFLCPFAGILSPCQSNSIQEAYHMNRNEGLLASLMTRVQSSSDNASVCAFPTQSAACVSILDSFPSFVRTYLVNARHLFGDPDKLLAAATALNVSLFQYVRDSTTGTYDIATANVFVAGPFSFFSWHYLYHWTKGLREVLVFEGDGSTISVLSDYRRLSQYSVNPAEIPRSLSLYFTVAIQYVTFGLLSIASVAVLYVVSHCGRVEAWNLLKLNRVGGIVWIGRPMLIIRAVSAICLLSTCQLTLVQNHDGHLTKFESISPSFVDTLQTILVSGEVCWLTYILNDVLSIVTKGYTRHYVTMSSIAHWFATALLQLTVPLTVKTSLSRQCTWRNLDVLCTTGVIEIGSCIRFYTLVGLSVLSIVGSLAIQRVRHPHVAAPKLPSLFLYSLGGFTFSFDEWTVDKVVYLDKASAFLNGLVVVGFGPRLYLLDVKTWRSYAIPKPDPRDVKWDPRLVDCVPLVPQD